MGSLIRVGALLAAGLLVGGCAASKPTDPFPSASPIRVVEVTSKVFPSVVRIDAKQEMYSGGKRSLVAGIGSGFIIDDAGHILTNFHVAGRAAEVHVTLYNKERVPAKLIGSDHWTDLAVLQMDMETVRSKAIDFKPAEMGQSGNLLPGQDVMAIGTPFGLARTLTIGVVSNNDRTFFTGDSGSMQKIDGEYETGDFNNWIQMDTPINPGNSGGPLVDMEGRVVGVNTRGGGQNLNFAIPIDIVREVAGKILASATADEQGHVNRSDLGLVLKPLQGFEQFYGIDLNRGVLVNGVDRTSPADKAGVRTQDILLEVNGAPINVRFPEELAAARKHIADLPIGSDVTLTLKRGSGIVKLPMKTLKLESAVGEEKELKEWGLSVRDITRAYANDARLDDDLGVLVTTLNPGYPAAKAELRAEDVIRSVNRKPVADLAEFMKVYNASVKAGETSILVEFKRGRQQQIAVLKVAKPATTSSPATTTTAPTGK